MSTASDNWFPKHRINVDEYYRMAEVGLLAHDARVELIEGEVIDMTPMGSWHAAVVDILNKQLVIAVADHAIVGVQRPIRLSPHSEPEPDFVLLNPRADFYSAAHPTAADVLLLIEVSDSSPRYDRDIKIPLYARHAIPEVWLIDLNSKQVQCMRGPSGGIYASTFVVQGGSIDVTALPGVSIDVSMVLKF